MSASARRNSSQFAGPSGVDQVNKIFQNGDKYTGGWKNNRPQGEGTYQWFDGSKYKGSWKEGRKDGLGTYYWPDGARYHGEWVHGAMHGVGTFEAPDGTSYQGSWFQDMKQGLGRKVFSNRDVYEGLWRENRCHGPGRYRWSNRDEYDGEWSMGVMHGKGTLRWRSGDRYDGEFKDGHEDGVGIFTWRNGATFQGFWKAGQKHGLGVYRNASHVASQRARHGSDQDGAGEASDSSVNIPRPSYDFEREAEGKANGTSNKSPSRNMFGNNMECAVPRRKQHDAEVELTRKASLGQSGEPQMLLRQYNAGQLVRERVLSAEELEAVLWKDGHLRRDPNIRNTMDAMGETIYKGHRSYDLMLDLQLGIRFSVGRDFRGDESVKKLQPKHFMVQRMQDFPSDGSLQTPPHPTSDFSWKDYCPAAFRKLRDVFSIDRADYMTSLCGDHALRELPSHGKSGSVFFLSHDGKYIIKTMRRGEIKLLLKLLPRYVEHVLQYPHTLLIKFYGLYRITPYQGAKVRFIVMNNLFQTNLPIQRKYDLKGSTLGRFSEKPPGPNVILKDKNLDLKFVLDSNWHEKLMKQLEVDCALLEELKVMDYSLLLGIHFKSSEQSSAAADANKEDEGDEDAGEQQEGPTSRESELVTPSASGSGRLPFQERDFEWEPADGNAATDIAYEHARATHQAQQAEHKAKGQEEAWRARILQRLGSGLGEQKMQDLLDLAHFKMLSREPKSLTPSMILARRSLIPRVDLSARATNAAAVEATDQLTQALGGSRVQLGMNMKCTCLPLAESQDEQHRPPEECLCYFGIIDILQEYDTGKRLEHAIKSLRHGSEVISAVHPRPYSRRFQAFIRKHFG